MKRLMMLAMMAALSGCVTEYTGSRTVVGEQTALPEISDASDSLAVRVYESVKGAMHLDVTIEPLDISTAQPK